MKASSPSINDYQKLNNPTSNEDTNDGKEIEENIPNELSTTNPNPPRWNDWNS